MKTNRQKIKPNQEENQILKEVLKSKHGRIALCENSFVYFCFTYFQHYLSNKFADFHADIIDALEDPTQDFLNIIVFRGSGKSSLISTMFTIWNIVYKKKHYIMLGSDVKESAQTQMDTVIYELQANELLIADFGKLYKEPKGTSEVSKKKTVSDFVTENDIRVAVASRGKKVRGERHRQYRPDLVLVDDPESVETAQKVEQRDKMQRWLKNEVMGGMNQTDQKLVVVGNWVHNDCIVARLTKDDAWKTIKVPIMNAEQKLAWPNRYVMTEGEVMRENVISIESLKKKYGSLVFRQEFMLEAIDPESQIIRMEWGQWIPRVSRETLDNLVLRMYVDSAVGQKQENDETAILIAGYDPTLKKLYLIDGCSGRYKMSEIIQKVAYFADYYGSETVRPRVEAVAANEYLCQQIEREHRKLRVVRIRPTKDKRSRLISTSVYWERGDILMNKSVPWIEKVFNQVVYFGKEKHDDCMDVATHAIEDFLMPKSRSGVRLKK